MSEMTPEEWLVQARACLRRQGMNVDEMSDAEVARAMMELMRQAAETVTQAFESLIPAFKRVAAGLRSFNAALQKARLSAPYE